MASIISAGTSAGTALNLTGDTSGALALQTNNGTTALTIDTSQNVGIGIASPGAKLDVRGPSGYLGYFRDSGNGSYGSFKSDASGPILEYGNGSAGFRFSDGSTERMRIDSSGNVGIGTSTPAYSPNSPRTYLSIKGSSDSGVLQLTTAASSSGDSVNLGNIEWINTNNTSSSSLRVAYISAFTSGTTANNNGAFISFATKPDGVSGVGTERMRIDASGNVSIGRAAGIGGSKFLVKASTTGTGQWVTYTANTVDDVMFGVLDSGAISTGAFTNSPYNFTTGSAANMFVASSGLLYRSTSSLKYKTDVQDATHGLAEVLKLRPVTYRGKNDGETVFGGLIAEEVDEAGLSEFVVYRDDDGTPDALNYGNMVSLAFKAIQEQQALIDNLTTRLAALEGTK